jgi:hypothetical protein
MIAVLVGEEDAIELRRGDPALLEPDDDLPRAQSSINENPAMISRDKGAISGAAAAEHRQTEHGSISSGTDALSQTGNADARQKNVVTWLEDDSFLAMSRAFSKVRT